jgi:hypothetical protein
LSLIKQINSKFYFFLILVFLLSGCGGFKYNVAYSPNENAPKLFNSTAGKIFIFPFEDKRKNPDEITNVGFYGSLVSHAPEKPLKEVIYDGFKQELEQRGLVVTNNLKESNGFLKGVLNTFEFSSTPTGSVSSKGTLNILLYSNKTSEKIWSGASEAIVQDNPKDWSENGIDVANRAFNSVVKKLIQRVVDNPDFQDAVFILTK